MTTIHDSGIVKTSVGYDVQVITQLDAGHRVRTKLHRDNYPNQSYVLAELWTPTHGWLQVFRATAEEIEMPSPYSKESSLHADVYDVIAKAYGIAVEVLG